MRVPALKRLDVIASLEELRISPALIDGASDLVDGVEPPCLHPVDEALAHGAEHLGNARVPCLQGWTQLAQDGDDPSLGLLAGGGLTLGQALGRRRPATTLPGPGPGPGGR